MERMISRVLQRYGATIAICRGALQLEAKGFLQPITSQRQGKLLWTDLGGIPQGLYLYIGQVDVPLQIGDRLAHGGNGYVVRRTESRYVGTHPAYTWALCVRR